MTDVEFTACAQCPLELRHCDSWFIVLKVRTFSASEECGLRLCSAWCLVQWADEQLKKEVAYA